MTEKLKKTGSAKILSYLELVAPMLPAPVYWEDLNSVLLGGNEPVFKATGALVRDAYVGKTLYDIYPKEMADHIKRHNEEVMRRGETLSQEEAIADITTGELKYFVAIKAPLRDENGEIIGIVGTGIEITAQKEAERLKLESKVEQLRDQEKFLQIANQVAHDIRSPLASLLMIVKSCAEIPEEDRIALREAAISIGDIANNMLNRYQKKDADSIAKADERQTILVSAMLLQLLTDKKYQYLDLPIKIMHDFNQKAHFAFIKIAPSAFKRMLSNLINNAVDAFENKEGKLDLKMKADNEWMRIIVEDNGKGMPPELIDKIMNNEAVTAGKKAGHGIGLTQVRETLQTNQGSLAIQSMPGKGTKITLTFPRTTAPNWIAEEIRLGKEDVVVILDDDTSIHGAWAAHFEPCLKQAPEIKLKHFQMAKDALAFINSLTPVEKSKIFLLTDYELIKQELNGLHVVAKSQIQRSILVTSHYANPLVRDQAAKTGTKILPKQLASEIPIKIDETIQYATDEASLRSVDLVLVDDDKQFLQTLVLFAFADNTVDTYHDPRHFMDNAWKYPKNTKICLDKNFTTGGVNGLQIAKHLHEEGYSQLYLLSGDTFQPGDVPEYITVVSKSDLDELKVLA